MEIQQIMVGLLRQLDQLLPFVIRLRTIRLVWEELFRPLLVIRDCCTIRFLGNTANSGGAISSYRQTMFSMGNKYTKTSVNDTFVNGGFGGAIYVENGFMKSTFDTFGSNFAPRVSYTSFFTG